MATTGYTGALGGMAKDAVKGAGNALVGGLKGAILREMPAVTAGMAFGKELSKRANTPKMQPGGAPPTASTSSAMGGLAASVSLVAGQNKSNVINIEQVRQLKQLNNAVVNQSKLIAFQISDQKRKDQFAEEAANEQAFRDDELLKAIKNIGAGFGNGKNKNTGGGEGGGLGGLIGDYGKELALGGLAVLFRKQIASMLARIVASPLTGVAVNAAIAGGTFLASIGSGLAAALRTVVTTALRALIMNPIGLAALGLGSLFYYSKKTEEKQKQQARDNNQAVAPMPTKTYAEEAKQLREQARLEKDKVKQAELLNKAQLAQNKINQEKIASSPLSLANRQKDWKKDWDKTHNPDGTPKGVKSSDYLANLARAESNNDASAKNDKSTAAGLYQFLGDYKNKKGETVQGTWKGTVNSMVNAGVLTKDDAEANYMDDKNRFDPIKARKVAEYFTEKNRIGLKSNLGRDPTQADLYMAHFLGLGGNTSGAIQFLKLLKDNPDGNAALVDPAAANSNPSIFYKDRARTQPRTLSEVYALMSQKIGGNNSSIGPQTSDKDKKPSTANVPVVPNTPTGNQQGAPGQPPAVKIDNSGVNVSSGNPIMDQITAAFSTPFDKNKYGRGIQLAAGPGFKLDGGGGGGTQIKDDKPVPVHDEKVYKQNENIAKGQGVNAKNGSPIKSNAVNDGIARQTKALKPLFRNNSDIIAETNKTFLQQFRSTATNAFQQAITKGLFPKGFGVSADQAGRDDNFRGQQLQKIFGTDKVINEATTKLLGKQYGPMFAPMFNNLAQGYLEVGSRIAGRTVFQDLSKFGIGGLGAKETQELTGQIFGNFAAGNKKLALEQLLYGASGGKESGIALGPETLFAKYGFKNPAEGIQYFSSVLGEQVTQPFSKLMGADDRSKSVIWNPRAGANGTGAFVYADSGREATAADIRASGNYGAPVSQTNALGDYNNYRDPYGPGGPRNIVGGGAPVYRQVVDPNSGKMVAPSKRQILNLSNEEYMRDKVGNDQKADIQIELMKQNADAQAKIGADALKAAGEREAKRLEAEKNYEKAADVRTEANAAAVNHQAAKGADSIVVAVKEAGGIDEGGGSTPTGLEPPKAGDTVRKSGQLFGGTADGKGGVSPLSGMQEIGNFAFDMAKNALGGELTKNIKNPYAQMVANFAIQKGMNMGIDYLMKSGGIGDTLMSGAGKFLGDAASSAGSWIMDTAAPAVTSWFTSLLPFADGGPVMGPGTSRSDSIPALLSNGEFVVNAAASKKYRPLLDALNYTKYADGTNSAPGSVNALSKAFGTDKTLSSLGDQTDLLTSIDHSLLMLSGGGSGSGTSFSSYGGTGFDIGLGSPYAGSLSGGGANTVRGVSRSRQTQQKPSTMDYIEAIGGSLLKSYAIKTGVGMASTALFGATPGVLAGNALISAGFPTLGGMLGGTVATGTGLTAGAAGVTGLTAGGSGIGLTAGSASLGGTLGSSVAAIETGVGAATAAGGASSAAAAGGASTMGASLAAAAPYLLAAVAVFMIVDSYSGGGGSAPPPKEPKFHAAIYVAGNNNVSAIAPILETTEYHAVPDVFKTVAYGLLKVAFNATKTSEKVTNTTAPYDWVYIKVQHDRVSMLWGKGAPNPSTLTSDNAEEVKRWPALEESTNLNSYASDILALVRDEFKKTAKAENLGKLDQAADALGGYSLHSLSSGLVSDLKSGNYALDTSIEKGIYADNVAESNRISDLIRTSAANAAYISAATAAEYDSEGNLTKEATAGGENMIYSMKQGKFVKNTFGPDALLLDQGDRPVYNIEGTSAGLSVEDFVSASVAGTNRSANILQPPPATTGAGGTGSTNNTVVGGANIDNSSITTFVNSLTTSIDVVRSTGIQVGITG
jgi:hypothetical protein